MPKIEPQDIISVIAVVLAIIFYLITKRAEIIPVILGILGYLGSHRALSPSKEGEEKKDGK